MPKQATARTSTKGAAPSHRLLSDDKVGDAIETINTRLTQLSGILECVDIAQHHDNKIKASNEAIRDTMWAAQLLLDEARECARVLGEVAMEVALLERGHVNG